MTKHFLKPKINKVLKNNSLSFDSFKIQHSLIQH